MASFMQPTRKSWALFASEQVIAHMPLPNNLVSWLDEKARREQGITCRRQLTIGGLSQYS